MVCKLNVYFPQNESWTYSFKSVEVKSSLASESLFTSLEKNINLVISGFIHVLVEPDDVNIGGPRQIRRDGPLFLSL